MGNDLISIDTGDFVLFQSTFPRGERPSSSTRIPFLSQFQSTFPRGERRCQCEHWLAIFFISIHVPAWGTTIQSECPRAALRFQSTFPRGERLRRPSTIFCNAPFQSTFPRGERLQLRCAIMTQIMISIHVPAWGTTK